MNELNRRVLEGIRVIDMSHVVQAPVAAAMLGDLGADVFHVEQLGVGDPVRKMPGIMGISAALPGGRNALFEYCNRNKRGIAVDLKRPGGREIMHDLVKNCDVFLTNFLPDDAAKLGIDYATLSAINPRLVYAGTSGYGAVGPERNARAFDPDGPARSGLAMALSDPTTNTPGMLPPMMSDHLSGVNFFIGILTALMARERFGFGQEVRCSLLGTGVNAVSVSLAFQLLAGSEFPPVSAETKTVSDRPYACGDGKWIQICVQRDLDWQRFVRAIGLPELEFDPETDTRVKRSGRPSARIVGLIAGRFASRTREEWMNALREAGLSCSPMNRVADLQNDPMVIANKYIVEYDHPVLGKIKLPGFPNSLSKTPFAVTRPAPELGEHTEEVLIEVCGYSREDIARLRSQAAI